MAVAFTQLATMSASTSQATSYAGTAGTPAAGDLLIAFVLASDTTAAGTMTGSWTWTKLLSFTKNGGLDTFYVFWAIATAATSTTPTFDCTGDQATGCLIYCLRVTGDNPKIRPFIRQFKTNTGSSTNPSVTMNTAILTGNGVCGMVGNGTNSSTQFTAPTSWTENAENTYATPSNALEVASRASGETGSTITWTNSNTTAWGAVVLEIAVDGSVPSNPVDTTPLKRYRQYDNKQHYFLNLLMSTLAPVEPRIAISTHKKAAIKFVGKELFPNIVVLQPVIDTTTQLREPQFLRDKQLPKDPKSWVPQNLLTNTLGIAVVQDPLVNDPETPLKRRRFPKFNETFINLLTTTLEETTVIRVSPSLEIPSKRKFKYSEIFNNLLGTTLSGVIVPPEFQPGAKTVNLMVRRHRHSIDEIFPNLILSTLTSIPLPAPLCCELLDPKVRKNPYLKTDLITNYLVGTLSIPVFEGPFVGENPKLIKRTRYKQSLDFINATLIVSGIPSPPVGSSATLRMTLRLVRQWIKEKEIGGQS